MLREELYAVAVADGYSLVSKGKSFGICSIIGGFNAARASAWTLRAFSFSLYCIESMISLKISS